MLFKLKPVVFFVLYSKLFLIYNLLFRFNKNILTFVHFLNNMATLFTNTNGLVVNKEPLYQESICVLLWLE